MDEQVIDQPELGTEVEEVVEPQAENEPEQQAGESDKKFSVRFSNWLKTTRDSATDPEVAKFAKYGKDLEGRDRALRELYPNGVNDVREVKAILDGLQYGEAKGVEAINAIQDQIRDYEQSDELLAAGDPKVLDLFDEQFNPGLAKLAPAILDRVQQSDPTAYSATILPHLMSALGASPMVQGLSQISSILNEQPPAWLTADQKTHWINEKFGKIVSSFNSIATWYDAQLDATKNVPRGTLPVNGKAPQDTLSQERQQLEDQQREMHWDRNIHPQTKAFGNNRFQELFKPYAGRLKLDAPAVDGLKKAFLSGVVERLSKDRNYMSQLARYQKQRNPDGNMVVNLANVNFDKHAKGVMDALIQERYRPFLGSKQNPTPRATNGTFQPANGSGPHVVSVRPAANEIDYPNTPTDWLNTKPDGSKQFMLKNGKTVIYRPNR